MSYLLSIAFQ
jgi:hypothetical protein